MSGDLLYFIFIIIIFIISMINKAMKEKKAPPPRPAAKSPRPPAKAAQNESVEDVLKRELSDIFGIPQPPPEKKVPIKKVPPKVQAAKTIVSESQRRAEKFEKSSFPSTEAAVVPERRKLDKVPEEKTATASAIEVELNSLQERLIWAEILGQPRALRGKHRLI